MKEMCAMTATRRKVWAVLGWALLALAVGGTLAGLAYDAVLRPMHDDYRRETERGRELNKKLGEL
jgi:hypothetical protein